MGFGTNDDDDVVLVDDDGGGGGGGRSDCTSGGKSFGFVSCSICLETVTDNGDRSWAKLQCGHQFHLDCIGSAFNVKGAMQCPNCRKVEKGQWLYANGYRSLPDFGMGEFAHDEDLYDLSYSEMSFGVHWCPFGSLARLPSSFEEGEFSSTAYHDLLGHHAIFAEHTAVSSATHPCPYIAYFGPLHPSSSNSSSSVSDGSSFSNPWSGPSVHSEVPASYTFPGMDVHYHSWEQQHTSPFSTSTSRMASVDQPSIPSVPQRSARTISDIRSGPFPHQFHVSHRAGNSAASSMVPPYPGSNARARDRVQALQAYYQQQQPSNSPPMRTPIVSGNRRSNGHRGVSQVGPVASPPDQNGGFYFFPSGTSSRGFQEAESPLTNRYHSWERDHLPPLSSNQIDRDSGWASLHQVGGGVSDPNIRRRRHGNERTLSQNHP